MRVRIVRLAVALAALTIIVFGIPLAVAAAQYLTSDRYQALEGYADVAALAVSGDLTAGPGSDVPAGTDISVYDRSGHRVYGTGPAVAVGVISQALNGTSGHGVVDGRLAATASVSDGDAVVGAVMASTSTSQVYIRIALVWLAMVALAAGALALTWVLARRQAHRLVVPLQVLSSTAEKLGGGDFTVQVAICGIPEIDSVSRSVNHTALQLGALVDRERAFSADASHQLRTPLTGMRLQLEAALDQPDADPRLAITAALISADRLDAIIDDLLALARDLPLTVQSVDLDAMVAAIRSRWHPVLAAQGRPLQVTGTGEPHVALPTAVLDQVVDVLVDNAGRHGRGAVTVTVRVLDEAVAVDVADDGPPLLTDNATLFQRRSRQAGNHGIGLPLARRLAESQGGQLRLTRTAPPTFTVLMPRLNLDPEATVPSSI